MNCYFKKRVYNKCAVKRTNALTKPIIHSLQLSINIKYTKFRNNTGVGYWFTSTKCSLSTVVESFQSISSLSHLPCIFSHSKQKQSHRFISILHLLLVLSQRNSLTSLHWCLLIYYSMHSIPITHSITPYVECDVEALNKYMRTHFSCNHFDHSLILSTMDTYNHI